MKKVFFGIIVILFASSSNAQDIKFASSNNSRFFVTLKYTGKKEKKEKVYKNRKEKIKIVKVDGYKLNIYKISTKEWLRSIEFTVDPKSSPEKIGISNNGALCFAQVGKHARFWSIITGENIHSGYVDNVFFPIGTEYFVTTINNQVAIRDIFSAKAKGKFKISGVKTVKGIKVSSNGKHILAQGDRNRMAIFTIKSNQKAKSVRGNQSLIHNNNKTANILIAQGNALNIEKYHLEKKQKLSKFNVGTFVRSYNTEQRKKLKEMNRDSVFVPMILHPSRCKLLADGKSIGLYLTRQITEDSLQEFLYIVDIGQKKVTNILADHEYKNNLKLAEFEVYDKKSLVIPFGEHSAGIYEIEHQQMLNSLWYLFERKIDNDRYSIKKQIKKRHISPNFKYVIIESNNYKNPVIYAKPTVAEQEYSKLDNSLYLGYSSNSKYLFVQKTDGKLAYIETFDIAAGISDKIPFQYFADTLTYFTPEDLIEDDALAPEDYNYVRINGFKHISKLDPKTNIHLHFKTMALSQVQSGIQLHLIDKDGIYYYGASEKEWLYIWRKLIVQFAGDNSIKHVKKFKVEEHFGNDSLNNSISLVLDHSGSMGNSRAIAIQEASVDFVKKKAQKDKVAIVKYDEKIGLDAKLTANSKQLTKKVKINGLKGYGGGTALLDATAYGASVLKENPGEAKRSVVILTDGNENSSYLNKGEVLKYANQNDVKINTIGFGSFVSEDYLKALSYYTQGSYYQIYRTSDFDWIFNDIYKKMNHFYTISFETNKIGEYKAVLEIALDSIRRDTMITVFKTEPINYDSLALDIDSLPFMPPVTEFKIIEEAEIDDIIEFSDSIEDSLPIIAPEIVQEFNEIEFPDIKFVSKKTEIANGTEKGIENVVKFLNKHKYIKIEVAGHTDNTGNDKFNLELSMKRAQKVKELLLQQGIEENRITTKGYGETVPIEDNKTEEGRQKNRRVEFLIIRKK